MQLAWSLALGTVGFVFFGVLSDRIGRKPIILAGCLIAAVTFFPVFKLINETANPALAAAQQATVVVTVDPAECHFQFNPTDTVKFNSSCDVATAILAQNSGQLHHDHAPAGSPASVKLGETTVTAYDAGANTADIAKAKAAVDAAKAAIDPARMKALHDADKALAAPKTAASDTEKALKAAADDTAKATAQTALDAVNAAIPPAQTALDAARAAVRADQLAALDAASAEAAKQGGVKAAFETGVNDALLAAGFPLIAKNNTAAVKSANILDVLTSQHLTLLALITYLIVLVTMVYGPIAAILAEL